MSDVFISYARSTAEAAERIADALSAEGYQVWRDDQIPAGRAFADVISERLAEAKAVLVVWSADAARSEWVRSEAERARGDRKLVQLTLDGAVLPMPFDQIQCADLRGWAGETGWAGWKQVAGAIATLTGRATPASAAPAPIASAPNGKSICVLPFANMSGDPEQEYFSDGISEDIITDLSKVAALSVVSRNTAFTFKGRNVDLRQLAGQLGVSHVLEGSVRRSGQRVRITAQLIEAASDSHIWAERYDRDLTDIFALQDEISQAIVSALKLKLTPQEKKAIETRGAANAEAYNLYLMARQYVVTGNPDVRGLQAAMRLAHAAIVIDPTYAKAWALKGDAQMLLHYRQRVGENGMAAVDQALALDPNLAEAHAAKGRILVAADRFEEAEREIALALKLGPESYEAHLHAAYLAFRRPDMRQAIVHYEAATALLETGFHAPMMLITCYEFVGDKDGAARAARIALARAEKAVELDRGNGYAIGAVVTALAALGEVERAREWIARAMLIDPDNRMMRYNIICSLAQQLNDREGALDMLDGYLEQATLAELQHLQADPDLDPLRDDPRYKTMIQALAARFADQPR